MEILKAKEYISEKLEIQPVSKDRLAHLKDKGFFIYQDKWGQAFVSPEAIKSSKLSFVKRVFSINDMFDFIELELNPTTTIYSPKMIQKLIDFYGFDSMEDIMDNKGINLFDPDTVNNTQITYIDTALDLTKWLLEH